MNSTKKLLFVCTGNICRSPLAHAVFEHQASAAGGDLSFEVESAGTDAYHVGEDADSRMRATAARRGVPFNHRARRISREDLEEYDYIFVMDRGHERKLRGMAAAAGLGNLDGKIRMYREFDPQGSASDEVPDPWYGGQDGFDLVYDIVERTSREILRALEDGRL
jgi:protein-tyrosine phosphatase